MYYLGIISAVFLFLSSGYLLFRVNGHKGMSVSQHAATSRRTSQYWGVCYIVGTTTYNLFLAVWLVPKLGLPNYWIAVLVLATVMDWLLAIVPERPGVKKTIHRVAAYLAAGLALFLVIVMAVALPVGFVKSVVLGSAILMVAMICLLIHPTTKNAFLIWQVVYVVLFYLATLTAAYV